MFSKDQMLLENYKYFLDGDILDLNEYAIYASSSNELLLYLTCPECSNRLSTTGFFSGLDNLHDESTIGYNCKYCADKSKKETGFEWFLEYIPYDFYLKKKEWQIFRKLRYGAMNRSNDNFVVISDYNNRNPDDEYLRENPLLDNYVRQFKKNIKQMYHTDSFEYDGGIGL